MKLYFKVAFRNLSRHSRQSLAAILSIAAGFVALVIFEGYIEESRRMMYVETRERMMFGDVNIENRGLNTPAGRTEPWRFQVTQADQAIVEAALESDPEVTFWSKALNFDGLLSNGRVSALFLGLGYDIQRGPQMRGRDWFWNVLYGVPLEKAHDTSVLLGRTLGQKIGCVPNPPQQISRTLKGYPPIERPFKCESSQIQFTSSTASGQVTALDLEVVGLLDGGMRELDARWVVMPLEQAQSLANTRDVTYYSVALKDPSRARAFAARLQQAFNDRGLQLEALSWMDHRRVGELYRKVTSLLDVFRNFVIIVILCIATLSVLNTLIKIVKERTREIGTWRSLGYTRAHLVRFYVAEAFLLGVVGCSLGVAASIVITVGVNASDILYDGGLFAEPVPLLIAGVPMDYVVSSVILITLCVLSALWAIHRVLGSKISENLIYA